MPAIGTSSDLYQHRDPALTTYRRNTAAPTLAEAMAERPQDKARAAARLAPAKPELQRPAADRSAQAGPVRPAPDAGPVTPQKQVHELYAPPSRTRREHDDRHAMLTGGTIDLRA